MVNQLILMNCLRWGEEKFTPKGSPNRGESKVWTFSLADENNCVSIFDIKDIVINAVSSDGWAIESIVTILADSKGQTFTGSIDREVYGEVDQSMNNWS